MSQPLPFGPVMIDVAGLTLTPAEQEMINHPNTGAIILFSRNFSDPEQVTDLIRAIRDARQGRILIAVDQEGGRVQRFRNGFTHLPPASRYAETENPGQLAQTAGWLMAAELLSVGVDFSFAPVLDVDCGISTIIGNRSFSRNPGECTHLASQFRKGMIEAGMSATGKHFPGHGAIAQDSHLTLPVDERSLDLIREHDLLPFRKLIDEGLEAIMPAHVVYPQVDDRPAGFSSFWIEEILRRELSFDGTVFSDDLSMAGAAVAGDFPQRARQALQAGCDMVLVCNDPDAAAQVLEAIAITDNLHRERRLKNMAARPFPSREQLLKSPKWLESATLIRNLREENQCT